MATYPAGLMTRAAQWVGLVAGGVFAIGGAIAFQTTGATAPQAAPPAQVAARPVSTPPVKAPIVAPATPQGHSEGYSDLLKFEQDERVRTSLMMARSNLAGVLKDPEASEYKDVFAYPAKIGGTDWYVYCGQINAKNGYGGYVGFQRFIAGPWGVEFETKNPNFEDLSWKWCAGVGSPAHW